MASPAGDEAHHEPRHQMVDVARAIACGSDGDSDAGLGASDSASGMSATLGSVADFDVLHGHVAAYIGVGGRAKGREAAANGSSPAESIACGRLVE
jgi:hypothetical protein